MTTLAEELDIATMQSRTKLRAIRNLVDAMEMVWRLRDCPTTFEAGLLLREAKIDWEYIAKHEGLVRVPRDMDPADIGLIPVRPTMAAAE